MQEVGPYRSFISPMIQILTLSILVMILMFKIFKSRARVIFPLNLRLELLHLCINGRYVLRSYHGKNSCLISEKRNDNVFVRNNASWFLTLDSRMKTFINTKPAGWQIYVIRLGPIRTCCDFRSSEHIAICQTMLLEIPKNQF